MLLAITREVSSNIGSCELSYLRRQPIDVTLARKQHRQYEECLAALGCAICRLPEQASLPDSVFLEDTAIALDELAVITRPGAESRRPETESIAEVLGRYRNLAFMRAPETLDGGDVLRLGRTMFVGHSHRSNEAAIRRLREVLSDFGYSVIGIPMEGCLHLKSSVTQVAEDILLINPDWVDSRAFGRMHCIEVDRGEPCAANALLVGEAVVFPSSCSATRRRLEARGIRVVPVDVSELAKAEGGVTCCSLILDAPKINVSSDPTSKEQSSSRTGMHPPAAHRGFLSTKSLSDKERS